MLILLSAFLTASLFLSGSIFAQGPMEIWFVSQYGSAGTATLIKGPDGTVVLYDESGGTDGGNAVYNICAAEGISYIDYAIGGHYDYDHIGGLSQLSSQLGGDSAFGTYYDRGGSTNYDGAAIASSYYDIVNGNPKRETVVLDGSSDIVLGTYNGQTALLQFMSVGSADNGGSGDPALYIRGRSTVTSGISENNKSISALVSFPAASGAAGFDLYLGSDLEGTGELAVDDVVSDLRGSRDGAGVDVLLVDHHGSYTNGISSPTFFGNMNPELALISVWNNGFEHPRIEVVENLQQVVDPLDQRIIRLMPGDTNPTEGEWAPETMDYCHTTGSDSINGTVKITVSTDGLFYTVTGYGITESGLINHPVDEGVITPTPTVRVVTPTPAPSPSPTAVPSLDVVINEIAWMGTTYSTDAEWIEFYNPNPSSAIDISTWSIYGAHSGNLINFADADGWTTTTIPAGGYLVYGNSNFIFASGAEVAIWDATIQLLNTSPGEVRLYNAADAGGTLVDVANQPTGDWFAGEVGVGTMERIHPEVYGTTDSNWATWDGVAFATDSGSNDILGSPGAINSAYAEATPTPRVITPTPPPTRTPPPTPPPTASPTPSAIPTSTPTPTAVPTATPVPTAVPSGDVVINEIAWMGTTYSTSEEWIELYNTTGSPIDISGWSIYGADTGQVINFAAADGWAETTIAAGGYLLYCNSSTVFASGASEDIWDATIGMDNTNPGQVRLYDGANGSGNLIDVANQLSGDWFAGEAGVGTMERIDPYFYGTVSTNWMTWDGVAFATDSGGNDILGSPGAINSAFVGNTPTPTPRVITPTPTLTPASCDAITDGDMEYADITYWPHTDVTDVNSSAKATDRKQGGSQSLKGTGAAGRNISVSWFNAQTVGEIAASDPVTLSLWYGYQVHNYNTVKSATIYFDVKAASAGTWTTAWSHDLFYEISADFASSSISSLDISDSFTTDDTYQVRLRFVGQNDNDPSTYINIWWDDVILEVPCPVVATPTPTPRVITPTPTPKIVTPTPSAPPTSTPTVPPTLTPTPTAVPTVPPPATATPTPSPVPTASPVSTASPVPTASPTPEICTRISEGFDDFVDPAWTVPAGWTFSGIAGGDVYTTTGNFGYLSPSLKLDNTGDAATTAAFADAAWLQFWLKGQGTDDTSSLLVEEYWSGSWNEITTIVPLPTSGTYFTGLALNPATSQVKFSYTKVAGNIGLDDVLVACLVTPTPWVATPTPTPKVITPTPTPSAPPTTTPTASPVPTISPVPTASPAPSLTPNLLIDQVYRSPGDDYDYVVLFNPLEWAINLGDEGYTLNMQTDIDYGESYAFSSCDEIPAGGYFMVASQGRVDSVWADAVAPVRVVKGSTAGNSWVQLLKDSAQVDALGWATNPDYFETTGASGTITGSLAFFRSAYGIAHIDTNDNSADFTRSTYVPVSSGNVTNWFTHTLWPVEDLEPQEWSRVYAGGSDYYYQAINESHPPTDYDHYLYSNPSSATESAWFRLADFPWNTVEGDPCRRVNLQIRAFGYQTGLTRSSVILRSGGVESSREYRFSEQTGLVDWITGWDKDPATGGFWTQTGLSGLEIGIENDDDVSKILTQFYALVWYTGDPPPPSPTPTASYPPTPSPTPSLIPTATPPPTAIPTPSMSPTATPPPTVTPPPTPPPTATPVPTASPTPEICTRIDEGFDDFDIGTRPAGWTFTGCDANWDVYTSSGNFGHLPPSIKLDATGDSVASASFSNGDWLQFWVKGQNAHISSELLVEEYWSDSWNEVTTIAPIPNSGTMFTGLTLDPFASRVRFSYTKVSGNLALDDVLVSCRPSDGFQSVVFNEFAWFGTAASADDEWMELRSNSSSAINLQNWRIAAADGNPDFTILSDVSIPAYGFFLIERGTDGCIIDKTADFIYPVENEMDDSGDWMQLFDFDGALVDEVIEGSWFAGTGEPYYFTMERIDPEITGNVDWNWYDNNGVDITGTDADGNEINGTPGEENSEYDPTYVELVDFSATGYDGLIAVEWETGAETDNFGFIVHRSESERDEFQQVSVFIDASGNPTGGRYLFPDESVENGIRYYYKLEDISTDLESTLHGPVSATALSTGGELSYDPADYTAVGEKYITPTPVPLPTARPTAYSPFPIPHFPTPIPLPIVDRGDYDGDGTSDIAVFRSAGGLWLVRGMTRIYFGAAGDIPAAGNYAPDARSEIAIYRPSTGLWAIRNLSRFYFGAGEDIPVPADYSGDSLADAAVYRPASGLWAVRNWSRAHFGRPGDIPVPGDYDGDGKAEFTVYRPESGLWAVPGITRLYFGAAGDIPVPGDYSGDGTTEVGIFRPNSGLWVIRNLSRFYFGRPGDLPVPMGGMGAWKQVPAVYRPGSGFWAIRGVTRAYFGDRKDLPVTR